MEELVDIVYPGADFIAGEVYVVGGGGYDFIGSNLELFGNAVDYTNSLMLLIKNMLCSKLHYQKGFDVILFSHKIGPLVEELVDIVYPGADFIAGEVYVVGGGEYDCLYYSRA